MGCHDRARADAGRYEMEWAGICDTSGVGGASLHGLNELGVSLLVGEIDSKFFLVLTKSLSSTQDFLFVI